ncbi:MAG: DedA family protein [Actinomycetota bacterium]|nr:DedA family protein [Actinomycetota bacterium]
MHPITGIAALDWFLGMLDSHGYLLVFGFTIFENLFVIGSFTPGETVVMAAAFLSTPAQGSLSLPLVWIVSVVGTTVGSNISYFIGRRGGEDALLRYGRRFRISEERITEAEAYFYKHGSKTVFISRFAAGFKNFVPMIAGVSKMDLAYFQGWTILGAITYTSLMCAIGYFVGNNFDRALAIARSIGYVGLTIFALFLFALWYGRRAFFDRKLDEAAEEAELVRSLLDGAELHESGCPEPDELAEEDEAFDEP